MCVHSSDICVCVCSHVPRNIWIVYVPVLRLYVAFYGLLTVENTYQPVAGFGIARSKRVS